MNNEKNRVAQVPSANRCEIGMHAMESRPDSSRPGSGERVARPAQRFLARTTTSLIALACSVAHAQNADELAKQLSNPVASLTSVPLQLNDDEGFGPPGSGDRVLLNVQPVVPTSISESWNLISRTILPIVWQNDVAPGTGSQSGLGDITQSLFFSPKAPGASGWIWGVGPALLIPTATDDLLGTEKWGAGPTAVMLKQTPTGWTYGALVNHLWSFAGSSHRADVSSTFLQPFVSKGLGSGRTVTLNFESTYDWEMSQATIPSNLSYSKVTRIRGQLASYVVGARYYFDAPDGGPEWGVRFAFTLLFPKK